MTETRLIGDIGIKYMLYLDNSCFIIFSHIPTKYP